MECAGDPLSNCGGGKAITLYQKCSTGACTNIGNSPEGSIDPPAGPPYTSCSVSHPAVPTETSWSSKASSFPISSLFSAKPTTPTTTPSLIVAPIKNPATTTTTSTEEDCDDGPIETPPPTTMTSPATPDDFDDGEDDSDDEDADDEPEIPDCEDEPANLPISEKSSLSALPTYNDALTGFPTQSTFATVKKPGVTSPAVHTKVRTTAWTSVVTETYWAR